jgi:hypothetical protein
MFDVAISRCGRSDQVADPSVRDPGEPRRVSVV